MRLTRLLGVATIALILGMTTSAALAQSPDENSRGRGPAWAGWADALANRLGKTPDELRAAVVGAYRDVLARAVADGRLTQERADRMIERLESSRGIGPGVYARPAKPPGLRGKPGASGTQGPGGKAHGLAVRGVGQLAEFLGITPAELRQQLRAGKSLAQLAEASGKSRAELRSFLLEKSRTKLDEMVQSGRITREQADAMLQRLDAQVNALMDRAAPARAKDRGRTSFSRTSL